MNPLPEACVQASRDLERDPIQPSEATETHLKQCPACAEARILWIAQAEDPEPQVPVGYFERLPHRVLRKLPPPRSSRPSHTILLAAAGLLALALGLGGFWLGRAHQTPRLEATGPMFTPEATPVTEVPFHEGETPYLALEELSSDEARALLHRLSDPNPRS